MAETTETEPAATMSHGRAIHVRKARVSDAEEMCRMINYYADQQRMLPKSLLQIYENLRDYSVAFEPSVPDRPIGCGALHIYWENLAEIRALAVAPEMTRKGIGRALVEKLLEEARTLEIEQVFCFTYEPAFFSRFGFIQVEHRALPLKVYNECFHCPKLTKCDELAMVLQL
jgi:amino-acid N-acetyltransferase